MSCSQARRRGNAVAANCLLALVVSAAPEVAGEELAARPDAASSLAALTPADVGLCLETDRLGEHAATFVSGPLFQRLTSFPPLAKWVGQNGPQIHQFRSEFQRRFGLPPAKVWSGVFGGRTLFAVWPPAEEGTKGAALLLLEAPSRDVLDQTLERVVQLQREAGKWQDSLTVSCGEEACTVHVISGQEKSEQLFITSVGALGIAANREELVREALALRSGGESSRRTLANLPGYIAGNRRLSPRSAARLFVNPRPWDQGLSADLERKPPESHDAQVQRSFIETWRATEYVIAGLEVGAHVSLEAYVAWNGSALPQPVRDTAASLSGSAELLEKVPNHALAAVVGRIDAGRMIWQFGLRAIAASRQSLPGAEVKTEAPAIPPDWLIPATFAHGIGPDYAAYLAPPGAAGEDEVVTPLRLPFEWIAALNTRPLEPGDQRPSLAELAEPVLHSALTAATAATESSPSRTPLRMETAELGGTRITSVVGLPGPKGRALRFAYAADKSRFWLGSGLAAIQRSRELPIEASLAGMPQLRRLDSPSQLIYLNLRGMRELLQSTPALVDFLGATQGLDRPSAQHSCQELIALGGLADLAVASIRFDESGPAVLISISADEAHASRAPKPAAP